MKSERRKVVLYGNCQGSWLAKELALQPSVNRRFDIIYVSSRPVVPLFEKLKDPEFAVQFSHVFWQTAAGCTPPEFIPFLPSSCQQIRFPTLCLKWLWPLHIIDPSRHIEEPGFPDGRFPYGDRLLMNLISKGVPVESLYKQYIEFDLNKMIPLDRFAAIATKELEFNDKQSDIPVTNMIRDTFQSLQTFSAVNHPNPVILKMLLRQMMEALLDPGEHLKEMAPVEEWDILGHQEIPIHPQIAAHFGVKWATPEKTYRYGAVHLSLEQYVTAYGNHAAIPFQEGPQIHLDRANLAIRQKDLVHAERLLYRAAALYPQIPEFLLLLANLQLNQRKWLDAEKVARYGLMQFPKHSPFHLTLGIVLFSRGYPEEAIPSFRTAIELNPANQEARKGLTLAEKGAQLKKSRAGRSPSQPSV